jgi:hypothetical protein
VAYPTASSGRGRSRPLTDEAGGDRCLASFRLDDRLRRSLAAWAGRQDVARAHRCGLWRGHHGAHQALTHHNGAARCWFRWDEWGFRLGGPESPSSGRRSHSPPRADATATLNHQVPADHGADVTAPITVARTIALAPPDGSPQPNLPSEALSALAAAVERLADVIAAASRPAGPGARRSGGDSSRGRRRA